MTKYVVWGFVVVSGIFVGITGAWYCVYMDILHGYTSIFQSGFIPPGLM